MYHIFNFAVYYFINIIFHHFISLLYNIINSSVKNILRPPPPETEVMFPYGHKIVSIWKLFLIFHRSCFHLHPKRNKVPPTVFIHPHLRFLKSFCCSGSFYSIEQFL